MTRPLNCAAGGQDEPRRSRRSKEKPVLLPCGWRWLGFSFIPVCLTVVLGTTMPGWLPWPFQWLWRALFVCVGIWGFLQVLTSYAWDGDALITRFGPFSVRRQAVQPAALWALRRAASGGPILLDDDLHSVRERPTMTPIAGYFTWARSQRENGEVVVVPPYPISAQNWADIIDVPLRLYPPVDESEGG